MKNIEILKELEDRGLLKQLVVDGVIAPRVYTSMHIYYYVDAQQRAGVKKKMAVCHAAAVFSIAPRNIYRAISSLK